MRSSLINLTSFVASVASLSTTPSNIVFDHDGTYLSQLSKCPNKCLTSGTSSSNWTAYGNLDVLRSCHLPMHLDFALYNPVDDYSTSTKILACTEDTAIPSIKIASSRDSSCKVASKAIDATFTFATSADKTSDSEFAVLGLERLQNKISADLGCGARHDFLFHNNTVLGLYVGRNIASLDVGNKLLPILSKRIQDSGALSWYTAQYCGETVHDSVGIIIEASGNLGKVQQYVRSWTDGQCDINHDMKLSTQTIQLSTIETTPKQTPSQEHVRLVSRDTCQYVKVQKDGSCTQLAEQCGMPYQDFLNLHGPDYDSWCSHLQEDQVVCCNQGELPDLSPQQNADGSCVSYTVVTDDNCDKLSAKYSTTKDKLEEYNKNTWGWEGCKTLYTGSIMCLSAGKPPPPLEISNALCGPQVPGTQFPSESSIDIATLNPCPLKACCDKFGQCGVTSEFCTDEKADTGAPGTSPPNTNGCISNCGTDVVPSGKSTRSLTVMGYYEGWAPSRECNNMGVTDIPPGYYSRIHFAFAAVNKDFGVDVSDKIKDQFDQFTNGFETFHPDVQRVISFGGWSFSTDFDTYGIFRAAVTDANRQTFAKNVVDFIITHKLDGVDFDWEYPAAPDNQGTGIPIGDKDDAKRYVQFLQMVRDEIDSRAKGKTLSIAMPASYWYLKGFDPVDKFAAVVDYVVYMTYDLHGQWDYHNTWSTPGCKSGNCARSHVNLTETETALAMLTKAGMPSDKIMAGVSSYGRSFQLIDAGCKGDMCLYTGELSGATKGKCTDTAGYIANAEIDDIIQNNPSATSWHDDASDSDIMTYDGNQWVGYMTEKTRLGRFGKYLSWQLGGVSDWAIDLKYLGGPEWSDGDPDGFNIDPIPDCSGNYAKLEDIPAGDHPYCKNVYIIKAMAHDLENALNQYYAELKDHYDANFKEYTPMTTKQTFDSVMDWYYKHADQFTCTDESNKQTPCPTDDDKVLYGKAEEYWYHPKDTNAGWDPIMKQIADNFGFDAKADLGVNGGFKVYWPSIKDCPGEHSGKCGVQLHMPFLSTKWELPNPKEYISKALDHLKILKDNLYSIAGQARYQLYSGSLSDVILAAELPVYSTQVSVDGMHKVTAEIKKIHKEGLKMLLLALAQSITFLIPVIGNVLGRAGLAYAGRLGTILAIAADAGFAGYSIYEDPKSAVFLVYGLVLSLTSPGGRPNFAAAAKARGKMSADDIKSMTAMWQAKSDKLVSLRSCKY